MQNFWEKSGKSSQLGEKTILWQCKFFVLSVFHFFHRWKETNFPFGKHSWHLSLYVSLVFTSSPHLFFLLDLKQREFPRFLICNQPRAERTMTATFRIKDRKSDRDRKIFLLRIRLSLHLYLCIVLFFFWHFMPIPALLWKQFVRYLK